MKYVLSFDLGTGGVKASLYDEDGAALCSAYQEYPTFYDTEDYQEQRPEDWWTATCEAWTRLREKLEGDVPDIEGIGISGHSLGVAALDSEGKPVWDRTPIWSDGRATRQARRFFEKVPEKEWYQRTGNGFAAGQYPLFKIMWYRDHDEAGYKKTAYFIGTKDYLNYRLTGVVATDPSYASGSGAYDLAAGEYISSYLAAAGVEPAKLPEIRPSDEVIGTLTQEAARVLELPSSVKVVCGGVDNACTALGADCYTEGRAYISAGTSAWIAVCAKKPVLDFEKKPYVFAHCLPGYNVSATCIFSAGRSLQWMRDILKKELEQEANETGCSLYQVMDKKAELSPPGSRGLLFNPSLAGGSSLDKSYKLRGSFTGLSLMHTQADMIRSVMEGVCLNLRLALDELERFTKIQEEMLIVGGGGKSKLWSQIYADTFEKTILHTAVEQNAGALGAAALAAVGCGLWKNYSPVSKQHENPQRIKPILKNSAVYQKDLKIFQELSEVHAEIAERWSDENV